MLMVAACGAAISVKCEPASVVLTIAVHDTFPHCCVPRAQYVLSLTAVTDIGAKFAGTADPAVGYGVAAATTTGAGVDGTCDDGGDDATTGVLD
jgi:hypothetical protein